jgi:small subunit ribosomal protein S4
MGDPKKQRKKYATPRFKWRTDVLQSELKLVGQYGLRNKRELWRHETTLSRFREIARSLLSIPKEEREKQEKQLLNRLNRIGMLPDTAVLDDILDLSIEDILERRLQTIVFRKGLAKSIQQARQLIAHGHIAVSGQRVQTNSHLVFREEETELNYASDSIISNPTHPIRAAIQGAQGAQISSPTIGDGEGPHEQKS